ncbi:dynein regulatory complex protein 9 isoform X1 [Marmota monax]|nr:dynein regulatory complex protein 9 isoform X1 [Marmota monax]XP_046314058.1 dynein regulatory complex protein 9 isoform X1 [Marmota monax]XP_046314059.1 dynein regulatory complex protein 9 isoform X1 [Marmota monax]XP_046314060.1 dynein regulatory complex protein 9 isoform X1 [Marmota monax]
MEEDRPEDLPLSPKVWNPEVTVLVTGQPPSAVEEEEEESTNVVDIEVIPEIGEPLSLLEMLRLSAVLEDTLDQLSILNYIMPVHYERKQSTSMNISSLEKSLLVSTNKISTPVSTKEKSTLPEMPQGGQFSMEFNRMQDLVFKQPTMQSIMSTEIMKKIQIDRMFFSDVIENTMRELQDSGTFTTLLQTLNKERGKKMHFYDIIAREEKGRKQIKSLQKQLINVKKERQAEVQRRNEYIAHLKDQLQEMKAKTNLENLYMKRNTELQISQTQKKCNKTEELLLEEIEKLRMKTEEENRIHMEIEMFLRKEQQKLEEKLEFWMEKFDKDTEMKQNELNALKAAKASDLTHLQDLAKMIREYEQVIIEDRIEKEKTRKKIEQDELELRSAIKLQAWWRGTVVRREIGSFKMPKDKDDSKDAKGKGKGKGKDKDKRRGKK